MSNFQVRYRQFILDVMGMQFLKDPKNQGHICYDDFWVLSGETYNGPDISEWQKNYTNRSASAFLNASIFSAVSQSIGSDLGAFGSFESMGDDVAKNEIMARLGAEKLTDIKRRRPNNENALGLISEMVVAGWLRQKNIQYEYVSDTGLPDFFLPAKRIAIECKSYVNAESLGNCIEEHCSKAKKQLERGRQKWGMDILGVVALDLSRFQTLLDVDVPAFKGESIALINRAIHRRPQIDWVFCYWDFYQSLQNRTSIFRGGTWVKGVSSCSAEEPIEALKYYLSVGTRLQIPPAVLGRNSPCYCGSGKRYKQCHGVAF